MKTQNFILTILILLSILALPTFTTATLSFTGNTWSINQSCGSYIQDFTIDTDRDLLYILTNNGTLQVDDISSGTQVQRSCDNTITGLSGSTHIEYDAQYQRLLTDKNIYSITMFGPVPLFAQLAGGLGTGYPFTKVIGQNKYYAGTIIGATNCGSFPDTGANIVYATLNSTGSGWNALSLQISQDGAGNFGGTTVYADSTGNTFWTDEGQLNKYVPLETGINYNTTSISCSPYHHGSLSPYIGASTGTGTAVASGRLNEIYYDPAINYTFAITTSNTIQSYDVNGQVARGACTNAQTNSQQIFHAALNETYVIGYANSAGNAGIYKCDFTNIVSPTTTTEPISNDAGLFYKTFEPTTYAGRLFVAYYNISTASNPTQIRQITGYTNSQTQINSCGNGVTEVGEQCDLSGANGACPAACSATCQINTCSTNITTTTLSQAGYASFGNNYTLSDISFDGILSFITSHYADNTQSINYLETTDYTSSQFIQGQTIGPTFHSQRIINSNTNYTDGNTYINGNVWTGSDNNFYRFVNTASFNTIQIAGYDNLNNSNYIAKDVQPLNDTTNIVCAWNPYGGANIIATTDASPDSSFGGQFNQTGYAPIATTGTYDYCRQLIVDQNTKIAYVLTRNTLWIYNVTTPTPIQITAYTLLNPSSSSHQAMTLDSTNNYIYIAETTRVERVSTTAAITLGTCNPTPTNLYNFQTGDAILGVQSVDTGPDGNIYITTNAQIVNDNTNAGLRTYFTACNSSTSWTSGTNAYTNFDQTRQGLGTNSIIKSEVMRYDPISNYFHIIDQTGHYATYRITTGVTSTNTTNITGTGTYAVILQDTDTLAYIDYATLHLTGNGYDATSPPNPLTHTTTFSNIPTGVFLTLTITATNTTGSSYTSRTINNIYLPTTTLIQNTYYLTMPQTTTQTGNSTGELHLTFIDYKTAQKVPLVTVDILGFITYQEYITTSNTQGDIHITGITPDQYLVNIIPPSPLQPYAVIPTIHAGEIINFTVNLTTQTLLSGNDNTNSTTNSYAARGCTDFITNTWMCGMKDISCTQNTDCPSGQCIKYSGGGYCSDFNYNLCDKDKLERGQICIFQETFKGIGAGIGNHLLHNWFYYTILIGITMYGIILFRRPKK